MASEESVHRPLLSRKALVPFLIWIADLIACRDGLRKLPQEPCVSRMPPWSIGLWLGFLQHVELLKGRRDMARSEEAERAAGRERGRRLAAGEAGGAE